MIRVRPLPGRPALPLPAQQSVGASGMDVVASEGLILEPGAWAAVPTGLALEIPLGFEIQVRPRSGLALKYGVTVLNAPGTIDADYRGEVMVPLVNLGPQAFTVEHGMRIAQMVIAPIVRAEVREVGALDATARGEGGFGSTGR